jgi:hypothetical protein
MNELKAAIRRARSEWGEDPLVRLHEAEEGVEEHWQIFHPANLEFAKYLLSDEYGLEAQDVE